MNAKSLPKQSQLPRWLNVVLAASLALSPLLPTGTDDPKPGNHRDGIVQAAAAGSDRLPEVPSIAVATPPPAPVTAKARLQTAPGNHFARGYCTWWVAQRREVPWFGNAGSWYRNAQAAGFAVGHQAVPGAIYVSWENRRYGHVAYVESVNPDGSFTVSEMNFSGFGHVTTRTIYSGTTPLIGFIYGK